MRKFSFATTLLVAFIIAFCAAPATAQIGKRLKEAGNALKKSGTDLKKVAQQGGEQLRRWDVNAAEAMPLSAVDSVYLPDGRTLPLVPPTALPEKTADSFAVVLPYTGGELLVEAMRTGDTLRYAFANGGRLDTLTFASGGALAIAEMKYLRNEKACQAAGDPERWVAAANGIAIHFAKPWEQAAAAKAEAARKAAEAKAAEAKAKAAPTGKIGGKPTAPAPVAAAKPAAADTVTSAAPVAALDPAKVKGFTLTFKNGTARTVSGAPSQDGASWKFADGGFRLQVVSPTEIRFGALDLTSFTRQPDGSYAAPATDGRKIVFRQ